MKSIVRLFKLSVFMVILIMSATSCQEDNKVPITGITLEQTGTVTISVGETLELTAILHPDNTTERNLVWTTDKLGVVKVSDGLVTGLLPGTATVSVTSLDGSKMASVEVVVINPVNGIRLINSELSVAVGEKIIPLFVFTPHSTLERNVTWSTSDPDIASIDEITGEITGITLGSATITVTSLVNREMKDECIVNVVPVPVKGITLNKKTLNIEINGKTTVPYTITPYNADNQDVAWSSDKPEIATIDPATGEIIGIAFGKATITVTTDDLGFTDDCVVSVLHPVNLLLNPNFEEGGSATTMANNWTPIPEAWFKTYYSIDPVPNYSDTRSNNNGANFFASGQNGNFFAQYLTGTTAVRNEPNYTSGFFQVVTVESGISYFVSADIGFRANSNGQTFRNDETIKILSADGGSLIYQVPIPGNTSLGGTSGQSQVLLGGARGDLWGVFTVPDGVTSVRFQLDFRSPRPLTIVDNCQLRLAVE